MVNKANNSLKNDYESSSKDQSLSKKNQTINSQDNKIASIQSTSSIAPAA